MMLVRRKYTPRGLRPEQDEEPLSHSHLREASLSEHRQCGMHLGHTTAKCPVWERGVSETTFIRLATRDELGHTLKELWG